MPVTTRLPVRQGVKKEKTEEQKDLNVSEEKSNVSTPNRKRVCVFCEKKQNPSYTDVVSLRKYLSDRSRIIPAARSGVCAKHQRKVAKEIKYARHLALMPFVNKI